MNSKKSPLAFSVTELETELKPSVKQIAGVYQKERQKAEFRQLTVFVGLFAAAVAGRVALQFVPSVEPIIPIAVLAGFLFGPKEGFSMGAGAYVASNFFVWGLQGPWTLFQCIGAGLPGLAAGFIGKAKSPTSRDLILVSVSGTVLYEIILNLYGSAFTIGLFGLGLWTIPVYFLSSMPFSLAHIGSNAVFAKALEPVLKKLGGKKDGLEIIGIRRIVGDKRTDLRVLKAK